MENKEKFASHVGNFCDSLNRSVCSFSAWTVFSVFILWTALNLHLHLPESLLFEIKASLMGFE